MLKWFLLAGLGWKRDEFPTETLIVENRMRQFLSECTMFDSEVSTDGEDDYDDNDEPQSAVAVTEMKTKETLEWLKYEMETPTSLSRLCVYTIRRQLTYADPDGKSIFPAINQLPLPTRLKDSLKPRDIECDAECFNQKPIHRKHRLLSRYFTSVDTPHLDMECFYQRPVCSCIRDRLTSSMLFDLFDVLHHDHDFIHNAQPLSYYLPRRRRCEESAFNLFDVLHHHHDFIHNAQPLSYYLPRRRRCEESALYAKGHPGLNSKAEEKCECEVTRRSEKPRPQKRYCTSRKVQAKPTILHSVRRSRTILQPRRHH